MSNNIELSEDIAKHLRKRKVYFIIKRYLDVLLSLLALFILIPLLVITAAAIKCDSKGKVIFSQLRTGKDGKPFVMYKFRSMQEGAEARRNELLGLNEMDGPVFKISKDPRVTRVGSFIRKYSIDELPQLLNILRGDMSIVGPRPLAVYETKNLSEYENMRHMVKPGLTCYWQISGRNSTSFYDLIRLDLKYISQMGIKTDVRIIFKTFKAVLSKKGAC